MLKYKVGDIVVGKLLWGDDNLHEGVVVEQDAGISRDAVVVELSNGDRRIVLESTIKEGFGNQ